MTDIYEKIEQYSDCCFGLDAIEAEKKQLIDSVIPPEIKDKLVTEYGVPVCAHSGKAGRWLARSFDEARETQAEYYSRAREDKRRGDAFNTCNYPPKPAEELRELQPTLIDVPEPDPIPFWRW